MMEAVGIYVMPVCVLLILLFGIVKHVPVFSSFVSGAKEGLQTSLQILPTLVGLVTAITMLKASGALDVFSSLIAPAAEWIGIPAEVLPLAFLRPISGSGSLALLNQIFGQFGPDSLIAKIASVMTSATETTFYAIAVYYGAIGIKKTRHTVPAAVITDIATVLLSIWTVRLLFGAA